MMKQRVGIITLQYSNNYGGFLQTYALSRIVESLGYEPVIINRQPESKFQGMVGKLKYAVQKHLWKSFDDFRMDFFPETTEPLLSEDSIRKYADSFYAVIVGSDQVWRLEYTMKEGLGYNMFLDFVSDKTIKISYAASFGKDSFEGDIEVIKKVEMYLSRFKAISVREDSGLNICNNIFQVQASHVLDPTMLLSQADYMKLIKLDYPKITDNFVSYYFLDSSENKLRIAQEIADKYKSLLMNIYRPSEKPFSLRYNLIPKAKYIYPSFSSWLYKIKNAEFVIADSFHGIVFSIIFNKQFICIANKERGLARMESLLNMFNLSDRLVFDNELSNDFLNMNYIDYQPINRKVLELREKSIDFLKESLKS